MKQSIVIIIAAITSVSPAIASAATVELKNIYANIEVIPEDRADVVVDVHAGGGNLPAPKVTRLGGDVVVDGGLRPVNNCGGFPDRGVNLPGRGWSSSSSALNITIHTPREVHIKAGGAINGNVRAARAVDLRTDGCSRWRIADVGGTLSIHQSGAANIVAGSAGAAILELSGLTHVDMADAHALNVDMSGAGKVRLKSVSGPVDASLSGLGSVNIASGRAQRVKADVSGMGGFSLHGSASELDADVSGVGSVHVDHVSGAVRKSVSGIGRVSVGA